MSESEAVAPDPGHADKFNVDASVVFSQCAYCRHMSSAGTLGTAPACAAFPSAIPDAILRNELDHRRPIEGDEGMGEPGTHVLFGPREGVGPETLERLYAVLDGLA